jgi:hypothetical protein
MSAENQDLDSKYACSSVGLSMMCKGLINNIAIDMLIDTGSVYTLISYNLFKDVETKNQSKLFVSPLNLQLSLLIMKRLIYMESVM